MKQAERSATTAEVGAFYESRDQVKALVAQLQGRDGDEVYKLRSQIAARLKSLVTIIFVAPLGHAPLTRKTIEFLSDKPDAQPVIAHMERTSEDEPSTGAASRSGSPTAPCASSIRATRTRSSFTIKCLRSRTGRAWFAFIKAAMLRKS